MVKEAEKFRGADEKHVQQAAVSTWFGRRQAKMGQQLPSSSSPTAANMHTTETIIEQTDMHASPQPEEDYPAIKYREEME